MVSGWGWGTDGFPDQGHWASCGSQCAQASKTLSPHHMLALGLDPGPALWLCFFLADLELVPLWPPSFHPGASVSCPAYPTRPPAQLSKWSWLEFPGGLVVRL